MFKRQYKTIINALFIGLLIIAIYFINNLVIFNEYSLETIKNYLNSSGAAAPLLFIAIFTLVPLTFFPATILAIASGMVFGLYKGMIYTSLGALSSATLAFYITRFIGNGLVKNFFEKDIIGIQNLLNKKTFLIILLLRLIPLVPFDVISYGAGLSKARYTDYILATFIGTIPGIFVYTNIGDKIIKINSIEFYIAILLLILLFLISLFLKKKISLDNFRKL